MLFPCLYGIFVHPGGKQDRLPELFHSQAGTHTGEDLLCPCFTGNSGNTPLVLALNGVTVGLDDLLAALNALYGDKDFRESLDEPGVSVFCTLFDGFPCSIPNWEIIVPMANGRAYRNLTNVCRIVKSLLDDNGGVSNPRGFPKEWRRIIEKALFEHDVKAHVASLPELVLDQNEVSRAEMDLETVSRIMSTSDSSETDSDGAPMAVVDTHVDVPLPLSLPEGGWDSFMSRLDDVQRDYLHKALNGTSTKARIEKLINEMAMGEVGDVILEDGNVLNDYSDEILKRIG